jgi:hypothetical protein
MNIVFNILFNIFINMLNSIIFRASRALDQPHAVQVRLESMHAA